MVGGPLSLVAQLEQHVALARKVAVPGRLGIRLALHLPHQLLRLHQLRPAHACARVGVLWGEGGGQGVRGCSLPGSCLLSLAIEGSATCVRQKAACSLDGASIPQPIKLWGEEHEH